jgi:hypothetical protein
VSHLCALPLLLQDSEDDDSEDERIDQDFVAKMIKRNGLSAGDAQGPKSSKVQELPSEDDEEDSEDDDEDDDEVSDVVCCLCGALQCVVVSVFLVLGTWERAAGDNDSGGYDVTIFTNRFFRVTTTLCAVPCEPKLAAWFLICSLFLRMTTRRRRHPP